VVGQAIAIVETRPGAILAIESRTIRYAFRKSKLQTAVVTPFGVDVHDRPRNLKRFLGDFYVWWKDNENYAEQVHHWWRK
jgi:hypothetical protein